jgi:hypothetical protein
MTKGAEAALKRGDEVYVHTLGNVNGGVRAAWINKIESVGWRLEDQRQVAGPTGQRGALRWSLTFRRMQ